MKRIKSLLFALVIAPISALASPAVEMEIVDRDNGHTLPVYERQGRWYVAGVPGHRYSVRIRNHEAGRVLAVLSVDGVNAVTGQTAATSQAGYVLDPYEHADIHGWRKDLSEVAQFVFTSLPESYAAQTGRPANVGVIGLAVFRERVQRPRWNELDIAKQRAGSAASESHAPSPSVRGADAADAESARREDKLGTGHGDREYAPVGTTEFVRASHNPDRVIRIEYDSWSNLVARGIIRPHRHHPIEPDPFPVGFVPDPPRRRHW